MKRALLGKLLIAAAGVATVSMPTGQHVRTVPTAHHIITTQARAETPKAPAATATVTNVNSIRGLLPSGVELTGTHWCVWPHNRPQRGWRAVQSRRRHNERARRQRRNK